MPSTPVSWSRALSRSAATRAIWRMRMPLLAAELRGTLFEEGRDAFLRVRGAAHRRDCARLELHLCLQAIGEGAEQQPLGGTERERRTGGELARDLARFGIEVGVGEDLLDEPPVEGFGGGQDTIAKHEVARTREADAAREEVGRAAVGNEADPRVSHRELRLVGGEHDV